MHENRRKIYEQVKAATVAICIHTPQGRLIPYGSGINIDPNGVIVTCKHVIEDAQVQKDPDDGNKEFVPSKQGIESTDLIMYDFVSVFSLFNENRLELGIARFEVIHGPHSLDFAIGRLRPDSPLPYVKLGDSDDVFEGQSVFTCGFPLGSDLQPDEPVGSLFHRGIISGIRPHYLEKPRLMFLLDMSINPGNSGGPLCSEESGELIGVINARIHDDGLPTGIGCAIPSNLFKPFLNRLSSLTNQQLEGMEKGIWPFGKS